MTDKKELKKQVDDWTISPYKFAENYLGIQLNQYQKKLLRILSEDKKYFVPNLLFSDRVGRECIISLIRAILLPAMKILIICPSREVFDEYIKTYDSIVKHYPNFLSDQIENMSDMVINFKNGSFIEIVASKENNKTIRGYKGLVAATDFIR